jgi:hypothetical protein
MVSPGLALSPQEVAGASSLEESGHLRQSVKHTNLGLIDYSMSLWSINRNALSQSSRIYFSNAFLKAPFFMQEPEPK